jgi:integrase
MAKVALTKLDGTGKEISEANGNAGARVDKWRATMGKKLTGDKKERRIFDTEGEAKEWARQLLMERLGYGKAALPLDIRTEAVQCVEKLRPYNATLTQAVEFYIKHATPPGGKKLRFDELIDVFLAEREASGGHTGQGIKATTLKPMRSRLDRAKTAWGKRLPSEIGTAEIKRWLAKETKAPKTRNNYIGDLSNLFNYAVQEKYCGINPLAEIKASKIVHDEPEKLTPAQAANLLLASTTECPELTDGLAIALFAGLRRSEMCALDWSEIHLAEREIIITAEKSKVGTRRVVSISDNLAAWLSRKPQDHGPVVYFKTTFSDERRAMDVDTFGKKLANLIAEKPGSDGRPAIVDPWPKNAMRHSFASYFYGRTKNINLTAAESGNSPRIVERHYKGLAREAEVKAYWAILPAGAITNVVPMPAVA